MNKTAKVVIAGSLVSALYSQQVIAAGFALIENSASGMGNAFAGGAAIADDASTVWFNPAGMTRLKGDQISVAGHIISPSAEFSDNGSNIGANGGGAPLSGNVDDGGINALVPSFYYVTQLEGNAWFGIGVTVPFGLSTDYEDDWIGRYHATLSEVKTININPSFAFKFKDDLSVGLGLNLQYIEATLENKIDSALTCVGLQTNTSQDPRDCVPNAVIPGGTGTLVPGLASQDSSQSLSGDDWNIGWNIGLLYDLDGASRLGVAYRSSMDANLSGDVKFTVDPAFQTIIDTNPVAPKFLTNTGIVAGIELPAQLSVSYVRDIDSKLTVMADVTWTEWSNFDALVIKFDNLQQSTSNQPENWEDSYRYAIGANYQYTDKLILRFGIAHDQTPIPSAEDRTARIPGDDRRWVSLGAGYEIDSSTSIDVGYSHLFVDDTEINNTVPKSGQILLGEYNADVNILSVQGNFKF